MSVIKDKSIVVRGIEEHEAVKLSDSIRNYINDNFGEIEHLLDYVQEPVYVEMAATVSRPHPTNTQFDLRIHGPRFEIIVKKEGPELYKLIDEVLDLAVQKIIEHKDKQIDFRKKTDYHK